MSYNIDSIDTLHASAFMVAGEGRELFDRYENDLPEGCFLHAFAGKDPKDREHISITDLGWTGGGSGRAWQAFFPAVAAKILGRFEAVLIWEGGDAITGLRIVGGKMTEPTVRMELAREPDDLT